MKTSFYTILLSLLTIFGCSQTNEIKSGFNFDFEEVEKGMPIRWQNFGSPDYLISLDLVNKKSGKYAAVIEFNKDSSNFKAWSLTLPHNYDGSKITLSGYIKTEDIIDGYAGLWMRIDPFIAFDNMNQRGVKGSTDWENCP